MNRPFGRGMEGGVVHSPGSVTGSLDMDFYIHFYHFKFCTGDIGDIAKDTIWREYRKLRKP